MSCVSDRFICLLYRDLLLPWEDFLSKKQFPDINLINESLPSCLTIEPSIKPKQMFILEENWKKRKDQYIVLVQGSGKKTHLLMRMLRNSFAHGDITVCQRNKIRMIRVRHVHAGNLTIFGQMTERNLHLLISSITSRVK